MITYNNDVEFDNKDGYDISVVNGGHKKGVFGMWRFKAQQKKLERNNIMLLITRHKWSRLHSFVYDHKRKTEVELAIRKTKVCLHLLLCHHSPIAIILKVVDICPTLVLSVDSLNRTALHCAVIFLVCPKNVRFLIAMNPNAIYVKDFKEKIPLIYACDHACHQITVGFNQTETKSLSKNDLMNEITKFDKNSRSQVVRALLKEDPHTLNDTDYTGLKAIDYALRGGISLDILDFMKCINDREMKILAELQSNEKRSKLDKLPSIEYLLQQHNQERVDNCNGALTDFLGNNRLFHNYEHLPLDTLRLRHGHALDAMLNKNKPSSSPITLPTILDLNEDCGLISELTITSTCREITPTVSPT